jgi:hypothetical protein
MQRVIEMGELRTLACFSPMTYEFPPNSSFSTFHVCEASIK